jgi:uncharacterized membrane protein YesL
MGKALGLMVLFAAVGFLLSFTFLFYFGMIENVYVKFAVVVFVLWIFLFIRMIQFVMIPLWIYNEELKFGEVLKLSIKIIFMEGLTILGVMALNFFILALLTMSRAFSAILFYGMSSNIRIFLHKNIIAKYQPKVDEVEDERLKLAESYQKNPRRVGGNDGKDRRAEKEQRRRCRSEMTGAPIRLSFKAYQRTLCFL